MFRKPPHFRHPAVRDLAWVIGSVPLLDNSAAKIRLNLLDEEWMSDRFTRHLDWLEQLDQEPQALHAFLNLQVSKLIGKRFETLLQFWFENSEWFELVKHNVQMHDGDQTVGEIDFIVYDKYSDELLHIEAACKYYWSSAQSSQWETWLGPNRQDRLSLKMDKLKMQSRICDSKIGKAFLQENNIERPISVVYLKGYLFYPFNELGRSVLPALGHRHHQAGWYIHQNTLDRFIDTPRQWVILPRTHWISPYHSELNDLDILTGAEMIARVRQHMNRTTKAMLIAQTIEEGNFHREVSRGLILTD
jgi:hypothetical protein